MVLLDGWVCAFAFSILSYRMHRPRLASYSFSPSVSVCGCDGMHLGDSTMLRMRYESESASCGLPTNKGHSVGAISLAERALACEREGKHFNKGRVSVRDTDRGRIGLSVELLRAQL